MCSIRGIYTYYTSQGYVFLDTMDVREYDALQLSLPSSTLKVMNENDAVLVVYYNLHLY